LSQNSGSILEWISRFIYQYLFAHIKENFEKYMDECGLNDLFVYVCKQILVDKPADPFEYAAAILRQKAEETANATSK